jgi:hypothetical protein
MKRAVNLLVLLVMMAYTSCKSKMTAEDFDAYDKEAFSAYCTNDIHAAERALLDGLQGVSAYEGQHIANRDFDFAKATYYQRLFLIHRKLGETNKMEMDFQKSAEYLTRSNSKYGSPPPKIVSYDEFARILDYRERKANVRWKTNSVTKKTIGS